MSSQASPSLHTVAILILAMAVTDSEKSIASSFETPIIVVAVVGWIFLVVVIVVVVAGILWRRRHKYTL